MMRTVRFLVGLSMVVVGVALAAPMTTRLVDLLLVGPVGDGETGAVVVPGAAAWAGAPADPQGPAAAPPSGAGAFCIPDPRRGDAGTGPGDGVPPLPQPPSADVLPSQVSAGMAVDAGGFRAPPAPPAPLPGPPADVTLAPPAFASTYRSTLDVPPPPLLDVDAPSPLVMPLPSGEVTTAAASVAGPVDADGPIRARPVTYTPHVAEGWGGLDRAGGAAAGSEGPAAEPRGGAWVVRDGDDLTNIATRLYGHPGAAESIWNANRDRITDPALLPIGVSLRVPPSWSPPAARPADSGAVLEPARRPGSVRVGQGETLETLALRFYGDKQWADRLWEANRDRLRNPALVVPGMELRLP